MATFKDMRCHDFSVLQGAARKDDIGKETWIEELQNVHIDTEFDINKGGWVYRLSTNGDQFHVCDMTPFAFSQFCTRLGCPPNFMLKLPGALAKNNLDFFRNEQRGNRVSLKVKKLPDNTYVARGITSPTASYINNSTLLNLLEESATQTGMKVWQANITPQDFSARLIWGDEINIGTVNSPDNVNIGMHVVNSEVGAKSLQMQLIVFRIVCLNGMVHMIDGAPLYRRRNFSALTRDDIKVELQNAVKKIETHKSDIINKFQLAMDINVENVPLIISRVGKKYKMSKRLIVGVMEEFNRGKENNEYYNNKISIVNSLTKYAQQFGEDNRLKIETIAGEFLLDEEILTAPVTALRRGNTE